MLLTVSAHKQADHLVSELLGHLHAQLLGVQTQLHRMESNMSKALDDLKAQVAANTAVIGSAKLLINGIAARIDAAGTDAAALAALSTELKATDDDLSFAVAANTPATMVGMGGAPVAPAGTTTVPMAPAMPSDPAAPVMPPTTPTP